LLATPHGAGHHPRLPTPSPSLCRSPEELTPEELSTSHTPEYLTSLTWSVNVARIAEVPPAAILPNCLVQSAVLRPMRMMARGTVNAAHYAVTRGVGFNLGGGFHHASRGRGGGFCVYNDLSQALWSLRGVYGPSLRVMIVDLDAHQGDGHERDFASDPNTWIFDAFTPGIFPNARREMEAIRTLIYFRRDDDGSRFLVKLRAELRSALAEFKPHVVVYNAGTDILDGDPLSGLAITREAVIERDEVVFRCCGYPLSPAAAADAAAARATKAAAAVATVMHSSAPAGGATGSPPLPPPPPLPATSLPPPPPLPPPPASSAAAVAAGAGGGATPHDDPAPRTFIPIVMALSGGYQKVTADVIADCLENLHAKFGVLSATWRPPSSWTAPVPLSAAGAGAGMGVEAGGAGGTGGA